jgi:hypothetical protein
MIIRSIKKTSIFLELHRMPINNMHIRTKYPLAYAYLQKEFEQNGVNIAHIQLINVDKTKKAGVATRLACLPLTLLEKTLSKKSLSTDLQKQFNFAKTVIAHEIGHLKYHSTLMHALTPIAAIVSTVAIARHCPVMQAQLRGILLKTICAQSFVNAVDHLNEHLADWVAIKRFKKEPQALVDSATQLLALYQKGLVKTRKKTSNKLESLRDFTPFGTTIHSWLYDTHGSDIARANRLLKAAGIPSTQWLLCHELEQQFKERQEMGLLQRLNHWFFRKEDVDMPRIIKACKEFAAKMDAVELPEPLETYGQ